MVQIEQLVRGVSLFVGTITFEQILGPTQTSLLSSISIYSAISAKHAGVLNIQPNRQTYRPRYCVCSNRPPSVLCCGLKITKVAVVLVKLKACVIGLYLRRIWRVFRCETNGKLACRYHSKTPSTWPGMRERGYHVPERGSRDSERGSSKEDRGFHSSDFAARQWRRSRQSTGSSYATFDDWRDVTSGVTSHPGTSQCGGCETNSNASSGIGPRLASCSPLKELFTADELN